MELGQGISSIPDQLLLHTPLHQLFYLSSIFSLVVQYYLKYLGAKDFAASTPNKAKTYATIAATMVLKSTGSISTLIAARAIFKRRDTTRTKAAFNNSFNITHSPLVQDLQYNKQ